MQTMVCWVLMFIASGTILSAEKRKPDAPPAIFSERVQQYYQTYTAPAFVEKYFDPPRARWQRINAIPPSIAERNLTADPLFKMGYLNLKHYAKGDGVADDTQAIMDVLYEAYFFQLAVWVPSGTYLISDALECIVDRGSKGRHKAGNGFYIIGDPDHRPIFKLANQSKAFQDARNPKPILEFVGSKNNSGFGIGPRQEVGAWLMGDAGVSSIVIDCGQGNPGAIGFRCHGSQAVYAENLLIKAHGAFAGIKDMIGNAGYMANIEVQGGRYGIYAEKGQTGSIAGCTLVGQEEAAIYQAMGGWPLTIVGFKIEMDRGSVIKLVEASWKTNLNTSGHLSLVDGTVILKQSSTAFENLEAMNDCQGKDLYLRNVFVKGAGTLIHSFGHEKVAPAQGQWSHIREYAHASKRSVIMVDGKEQPAELIDIAAGTPPADMISRHALSRRGMPSPMDQDTVNIRDEQAMGKMAAKGDGVTDDTEAFRHAVKNFQKVFLPKGTYVLSGNVQLGKDTILFGTTSALSVVVANVGKWKDQDNTPVFSTVDDPSATCMISQITVMPSVGKGTWEKGWPLLDWKAGRNSTVKNFFPETMDWSMKIPDGPLIRISGNGGGRWYAYDGGANLWERTQTRKNYLHLLVEGTREPLILYSQCSIHGAMDYCNVIRHSRNVEMYGVMDENHPAGYLLMQNSENILITGIGTHLGETQNQKASLLLEKCQDVTIAILDGKDGMTWIRIQDDQGVKIPGENSVSYYRRGKSFHPVE